MWSQAVTLKVMWKLSRNSHGNCENNTGKRRMRSVWNMATTASVCWQRYKLQSCKNDMEDDEKDRCCCHCGQRLKWYE